MIDNLLVKIIYDENLKLKCVELEKSRFSHKFKVSYCIASEIQLIFLPNIVSILLKYLMNNMEASYSKDVN